MSLGILLIFKIPFVLHISNIERFDLLLSNLEILVFLLVLFFELQAPRSIDPHAKFFFEILQSLIFIA